MLYLENSTQAQKIVFPRTRKDLPGQNSYSLRLLKEGEERAVISGITDIAQKRYAVIAYITLPATVKAGEYEYELRAGSEIQSRGLLNVGAVSHARTTATIQKEKTICYGE